MKTMAVLAGATALVLGSVSVEAQSLTPLNTFGSNGWLSPAATPNWLGTGDLERGLAVNPVTGNLILMSRQGTPDGGLTSNPLVILNGTTGAFVGELNQGSGIISGGTFLRNMVAAGDDGAIYLTNLTTNASTSAFRVYRWANEAATPTVAFSGNPGAAARFGDSFDAIGSGANTRLVAGAAGTFNGVAYLSTVDGENFTGSYASVAGPANGAYRLGISFLNNSSLVAGTQGAQILSAIDVTGPSAVATAATFLPTGSSRPLDFAVVGGVPIMVSIDTVDGIVRVQDVSDLTNPQFILQGTTIVGAANANGNGAGQVRILPTGPDTALVYAMSTNNGIQAFTLTVPEPASLSLLAMGGLMLGRRRRA